jgi:hypothetical protein
MTMGSLGSLGKSENIVMNAARFGFATGNNELHCGREFL